MKKVVFMAYISHISVNAIQKTESETKINKVNHNLEIAEFNVYKFNSYIKLQKYMKDFVCKYNLRTKQQNHP